jgi:hypothetical protein
LTLLKRGGVRVLHNDNVELSRGEARLCLAGVDDRYTRRSDVAAAVRGRDAAVPLIALVHDPRTFDELADFGAALVLSGHTHWGQLALPLRPHRYNLARLMGYGEAGLMRHGSAQLYVSPGLGTTGAPLRLGVAPEISVLELRCAVPGSAPG